MKEVLLEYGDAKMAVQVPDHAVVVRDGENYVDPPPVDPVEATRKALRNPVGCPPLSGLVKKGSRVVIAFPDRVKGGTGQLSHRRTSIPIIIEELERAGVSRNDITLLCAIGLHRKNTREEMYEYLGRDIVDQFWGSRLVNHDAEDPQGIVDFGVDELGHRVEMNRRIAEADLAILIGHVQGNPYGGYSGGYKMPATGLSTWRSIRSHHSPDSLYRQDFLPVGTGSHFRKQLTTIGRAMEKGMGKPFFTVDAVLGTKAQVLGVYAGTTEAVEKASWPLADRRTNVTIDAEKADVLVFGLPRSFHYGPGMGTNPILCLQAIGATVARCSGAFRLGGAVIAPALFDGWFNDEWFPSYREVYEILSSVCYPWEITRYEEAISNRPDYIYKYRYCFGYHPFHAFSMVYMGGLALRYASAIIIPGARNPGLVRSMGCIPTRTFDEALEVARKHVGANPRILVLPEYLTKVPAHLTASRG